MIASRGDRVRAAVWIAVVIVLSHVASGASTGTQTSWKDAHKNRFDKIREILVASENTLRWLRDPLVPSPPQRCSGPAAEFPSRTGHASSDEVPLLRPAPQRQRECTAYESQSNCWSSSPLQDKRPITECPSVLKAKLGKSRVKQSVIAISGDFGLSGVGCTELVSDLLTKAERQFGNFTYLLSVGDGAYWDGSCKAHQNIYGGGVRSPRRSADEQLIYRRYFPSANSTCVDPVKIREGWWAARSATKSYQGYTHERRGTASRGTDVEPADFAQRLAQFFERNPGFKHLFPPLPRGGGSGLGGGSGDSSDGGSQSADAQHGGVSGLEVLAATLRFKPDPSVPEAVKLAQQVAHMKTALAQASPPAACNAEAASADESALDAEREAERAVLARLLAQFSVAGDFAAIDPRKYRFFPVLGNHDFDEVYKTIGRMPFNQYFPYLSQLPPGQDLSHGMYYTYVSPLLPQVQIFAVNSNLGHFGTDTDKLLYRTQVTWLRQSLLSSTAAFKLVYFHHPPHTTAVHDKNAQWMNLPFKSWGADAVLTGHQHAYERIVLPHSLARLEDRFEREHAYPAMSRNASALYFLNGLGGHNWVYSITGCDEHPGSQSRFNEKHGAMLAVVTESTNGQTIDIDPSSAGKAQVGGAGAEGATDAIDPEWALASSFFDKRRIKEQPASSQRVYKASKEISFCFYSIADEGKLVDSTSIFAP